MTILSKAIEHTNNQFEYLNKQHPTVTHARKDAITEGVQENDGKDVAHDHYIYNLLSKNTSKAHVLDSSHLDVHQDRKLVNFEICFNLMSDYGERSNLGLSCNNQVYANTQNGTFRNGSLNEFITTVAGECTRLRQELGDNANDVTVTALVYGHGCANDIDISDDQNGTHNFNIGRMITDLKQATDCNGIDFLIYACASGGNIAALQLDDLPQIPEIYVFGTANNTCDINSYVQIEDLDNVGNLGQGGVPLTEYVVF